MHPQSHLVVKSLRHVASLFAYACVLGWQDQRYTQAAHVVVNLFEVLKYTAPFSS